MKKILSMLAIVVIAFLLSVNYNIFVFPNSFAPAGVDGIGTLIQDAFHVNIGYFSLIVNIPLIIAAFVFLNRDFAIKNTVFVIAFSISSLALEGVNLSGFLYKTDNGTSTILAPVVAGVIRGLLYVVTLKLNAAGGGIDIISALIKHKKPHLNIMSIIFAINVAIACCAYFVYGRALEPVICSIIYSFTSSFVCTKVRLSAKEHMKYEIITEHPESLCDDILTKLSQRATIMDAHGAYSGNDTKVVMCVVGKEKAPYVEELILKYPNCTVFKSVVDDSVSGVTYK